MRPPLPNRSRHPRLSWQRPRVSMDAVTLRPHLLRPQQPRLRLNLHLVSMDGATQRRHLFQRQSPHQHRRLANMDEGTLPRLFQRQHQPPLQRLHLRLRHNPESSTDTAAASSHPLLLRRLPRHQQGHQPHLPVSRRRKTKERGTTK